MSVAALLLRSGWDVSIEWKNRDILSRINQRLGIDLREARITADGERGSGYDLVFWLSDGSIPALFGRKNILHFQTPFHDVGGRSVINRLKLMKIDGVVCNSQFTKRWIDREYGVDSDVIYPPVNVEDIIPLEKENIILNVGRFSALQQQKGHMVLIDAFQELYDEGKLNGWKLVLAGGSDVGADEYFEKLREAAKGYSIEIRENVDYDELCRLYGRAKIFWSAAGYGVNENTQPEKVEHFGISVVEAMGAGCVPVVVNKGGFKEIVLHERNGFLWDSLEVLQKVTLKMSNRESDLSALAAAGQNTAKDYSVQIFEDRIRQLLRI